MGHTEKQSLVIGFPLTVVQRCHLEVSPLKPPPFQGKIITLSLVQTITDDFIGGECAHSIRAPGKEENGSPSSATPLDFPASPLSNHQ